jgi:hypothetical protein
VSLNLTGQKTCEFHLKNGENDRAIGREMALVGGCSANLTGHKTHM